ncbi:MAG: V-type ATP synthase subunit D [Candidatus Marsarchaeota archaeon]|nr:V-type ATP synthase subunit D [Candidatus Marsarchaeota archaeon]
MVPQQLNPTRINLINLRVRIAKASTGHDILKRKREVLVMEFLGLIKESRDDRQKLYATLSRAYESVMIGEAYAGNLQLEGMAMHVKEISPIAIRVKNVMGVPLPQISGGQRAGQTYSFMSMNAASEDITEGFTKVTDSVIRIAQSEQSIIRLATEIDKTKRRVNALEYSVIPGMRGQAKYISMRLEEMEREMFTALKHVKKRLARAKAASDGRR